MPDTADARIVNRLKALRQALLTAIEQQDAPTVDALKVQARRNGLSKDQVAGAYRLALLDAHTNRRIAEERGRL